MPYKDINDLPDNVRHVLPKDALEIYLKVFNSAYDEYKDPSKRYTNESREVVSNKVAWSAVKKKFQKNEETGMWEKI